MHWSFPNRERNQMVIKSRNPLMKRSIPNLVSHISGLGVAPLFSYFPKPAFFAKTGMYRCISPETSMF
jgi:hypothetical protein